MHDFKSWQDDFLLIRKLFPGVKIGSDSKVGCVFPMVVVSLLPRAEVGLNDHQEDAQRFTLVPLYIDFAPSVPNYS